MRNVEQINDQWLVSVDEQTTVLLCDSEYWYSIASFNIGQMWCGYPVELFDSVELAENYISDNNLIKWVYIE